MYMDECDMAVYIYNSLGMKPFPQNICKCSSCSEKKLWLKVKKKDKGSAPEQKMAYTFSIQIDEMIP